MRRKLSDIKGLVLEKCTLDPKCRSELKTPMRNTELCKDCSNCGWNVDVIEARKNEPPHWIDDNRKGMFAK